MKEALHMQAFDKDQEQINQFLGTVATIDNDAMHTAKKEHHEQLAYFVKQCIVYSKDCPQQ